MGLMEAGNWSGTIFSDGWRAGGAGIAGGV
jgi:hypothetical protein